MRGVISKNDTALVKLFPKTSKFTVQTRGFEIAGTTPKISKEVSNYIDFFKNFGILYRKFQNFR